MYKFCQVAVAAVLAMAGAPATAAVVYTVRDVAALSGSGYADVFALSQSGQIAGGSQAAGGYHAFVSQKEGLVDLGTLGGATSSASGINVHGNVTGVSRVLNKNGSEGAGRAIFGSASTGLRDIGTLGGSTSSGIGLNDANQVTGSSYLAHDSLEHAFRWSADDGMVDLGTLGGETSRGYAINNSGFVTGIAQLKNSQIHAFLYGKNGMVDLGTLGGGFSTGNSINNFGWVAGTSAVDNGYNDHAFLYSGSDLIDLGTLGGFTSSGYGINNIGDVVGRSELTRDLKTDIHAFIYSAGTMHDLNDMIAPSSGWVLEEAYAINDRGSIVGIGRYQGEARSFLLTVGAPADPAPPAAAVPEPATWAMFIGGFGLIGSAMRRRQRVSVTFA